MNAIPHGAPTAPPSPTLQRILERACRAPSVHNSQPWRWRVDGPAISLLADPARRLMRIDPEGRDLLLSCGAALHHLRVAARAEGYASRVRREPFGAGDDALAVVDLVGTQVTPEDLAAAELIDRRRTDRRRFSSWEVPQERLAALVEAAHGEGARAVPVTGPQRARLVEILRRAARDQQLNWSAVDETAAWTGPRSADGVPEESVPRREDVERQADPVGMRFPSGTLVDDQVDAAGTEYDASRMLVLCTAADEPLDRLRAGEALSAVLLAATGEGLGTVPLSQATEVRSTRQLLRHEILDDVFTPQVVVRVGWRPISHSPVPPTPRRPLRDVLVD